MLKKNKKAPVVLNNYADAVDRCIPPASMILPACCLIGGGLALSTANDLIFPKDGNAENLPVGLIAAGIAGISLGAGIGMTVNAVQRANRNYNYMVCKAAEERRTADIFERIIKSGVYTGEKSFMETVNALDGVSDADKENLRRRYQEYVQGKIHDAAHTPDPAPAQQPPQTPPESGNTTDK